MVSLTPGDSIFTNEPIAVSLRKAIPVTLELAALAMIIGIAIAVPVGVLSAPRQDRASDYVRRVADSTPTGTAMAIPMIMARAASSRGLKSTRLNSNHT